MATNKGTNNGKGRVVTNAPNSGNGKTATSKKVGVRSGKGKSVRASVLRANARNASARVRQFATDDGLVDYLDSLPAVRMPANLANDTSANGARLRRAWCIAKGIPSVRAYDDGFMDRRAVGMPRTTNHWRPDNAVRVRLERIGNIGHGFGYTRTETASVQTRHVRSLDWSSGEPADYDGADRVFIYRV